MRWPSARLVGARGARRGDRSCKGFKGGKGGREAARAREEERAQLAEERLAQMKAELALVTGPHQLAAKQAADKFARLCHELDTFDFGQRRPGTSYYNVLLMEPKGGKPPTLE